MGRPFASACRCTNGSPNCWAPPRTKPNPMNTETKPKPMLLIVDDEKPTRDGLRAALEDHYDTWVAGDAKVAAQLLEEQHFSVLLTDFRLPQEDGLKLI